ncbi:MAG: hypothetical protein WCK90_00020 [archaeon]
MKKVNRGVLAVLLISSLLMISSIVLVSGAIEGLNLGSSQILNNLANGTIAGWVAKLIFFLIVMVVIILVLGNILGVNNRGWVILLSGLISFLATAYLTPAEVLSVLTSYEALGLTITSLIPIALITGLSYQAATAPVQGGGRVRLIMLQHFAWIMFGLYSLYKLGYALLSTDVYNGWVLLILMGVTIYAAILAIFNPALVRIVARRFLDAEDEAANVQVNRAVRGARALANAEQGLAGNSQGTGEFG